MLAHIPTFQMHYMSAPNAGERESCPVVKNYGLEPLKRTNP